LWKKSTIVAQQLYGKMVMIHVLAEKTIFRNCFRKLSSEPQTVFKNSDSFKNIS